MDVFASILSPQGPSLDTATVKSSPRSLVLRRTAAVLLAATGVFSSALAAADSAPPAVSGAVELADPPAALPPKKGAPPVAAIKGDGAKDAKKDASPEERALRGVVTIERAGQPLALGAVLMGDGRILTALSPLGPGNDLDGVVDGLVVAAEQRTMRAQHDGRRADLGLAQRERPDGRVLTHRLAR